MPLTRSQHEAVAARGNVIVVAGAGTGKTSTLVDRCLALVDAGCSIDEILMVTFTDAAAAEMRHRLQVKMAGALAQAAADRAEWWQEQLALLDTARICTLHSFCLQLVRENFHLLGIDPAVKIQDEQQTRPLIEAALDASLAPHYGGQDDSSAQVRELIRRHGRGDLERIRGLILKIHRHAQTLAAPERWYADQLAAFADLNPARWRAWLREEVLSWAQAWLPELQAARQSAPNLERCAVALQAMLAPDREPTACHLTEVLAADAAEWPKKQKTRLREPFKKFFEETAFLASQFQPVAEEDALAADWSNVREPMTGLLRLAREFGGHYLGAKRDLGGVDFHDLEQFALKLLWDEAGALTAMAEEMRARFQHVFVDECQDINEAQDTILRAVGRGAGGANRFLVGDVKQSIYQFRLARPELFRDYERAWQDGLAGRRIPLVENFRSHPRIIHFVNGLFESLMRDAVGGVQYEALQPGRVDGVRDAVADEPRVEFHLIPKAGLESEEGGETGNEPVQPAVPEDLAAVEREARQVALRLRQMRESGLQILDKDAGVRRPVEWRDMAVLLRSPGTRVEAFAKQFHKCGVPLQAERGGFLQSTEISDLLSLLRLLDNPLQDIPLLAVLRSPLVALTLDELAEVRVASGAKRFWLALREFLRQTGAGSRPEGPVSIRNARQKLDWFVRRFAVWRELARQASLSECLETVLRDTHYEALIAAGERGPERAANIRKFITTVRQYDPYQRQGLFRFLKFIDSLEAAEQDMEPAPVQCRDAVRLMSIHKSKGLEFPVVVVACLGARFNLQDLGNDVLLDREYGLCAKAVQPESGTRHPTLAHWRAARQQRRRILGEELRLLYVAATRARDYLLLTGTAARNDGDSWEAKGPRVIGTREILEAGSPLDWLLLWLPTVTRTTDWRDNSGIGEWLSWRICRDLVEVPAAPSGTGPVGATGGAAILGLEESTRELDAVLRRIGWQYPHVQATGAAAKTSVTAIRRRAAEFQDPDTKPVVFWQKSVGGSDKATGGLGAAEIGTLHHRFLQHMSLSGRCDGADVQAQIAGLAGRGVFTTAEASVLDVQKLAAFWSGPIGTVIRERATSIRRELAFTVRFSPAELRDLAGFGDLAPLQDEFVVVQGVADLVVFGENELWLLDFKTDQVRTEHVADKVASYRPQLQIYAAALTAIYGRPVTRRWLHFLMPSETIAL